jgi:hypothetical protein
VLSEKKFLNETKKHNLVDRGLEPGEHANVTPPGLQPMIYHTQGEHANVTPPGLQPMIYHTRGEHANVTPPGLQPTIYQVMFFRFVQKFYFGQHES